MASVIEPFRIAVAQPELAELRARLDSTRWPDEEPVGDWSQGVPLRQVQALCRRWAGEYDWRAAERRLNEIPQFRTEIDGVALHFLHVRSPDPSATPLVLTHGWPGSFLEFERTPRAAGRAGSVRRQCRQCLPRRRAVSARVRVQRAAHDDRMGHPPHRPRMV